jgi:AcrR family transcriptional regulator
MARTLNPASHAIRRDAFIDAAQRLIASKGYEQMSIQDVLDDVGASRGAFYHYFDSKAALLDAGVERFTNAAVATVQPLVEQPSGTAVEKFGQLMDGIASYKMASRELVLGIMAAWFSDENALVRDKFRRGLQPRLAPLLARILRQGVAEGTFALDDPEHCAVVLVSLIQGANELASLLYVERQADRISFEEVRRTFAAYEFAFNRILGAAPGSVSLANPALMAEWFG